MSNKVIQISYNIADDLLNLSKRYATQNIYGKPLISKSLNKNLSTILENVDIPTSKLDDLIALSRKPQATLDDAAAMLLSPVKTSVDDVVSLSKHYGKRIEDFNLLQTEQRYKYFTQYGKNGEIQLFYRGRNSADLNFLDHVRTGEYVTPRMNSCGTYKASKQAIEQSNKYAKEYISANETIMDGFRYGGPHAFYDDSGNLISRFGNGIETIIIDRIADKKLASAINAFESRITGKNLTESEKMNELLKYVDEVFSLNPQTKKTLDLVAQNLNVNSSKEFMFGDIINSGAGVCRHRALLTKILGDKIGLKTSMVNGYYGGGGHAWNEFVIGKDKYLFDAMHRKIFNISNPERSIMPEVMNYGRSATGNRIESMYCKQNSPADIIYKQLKNNGVINTNAMTIEPYVANGSKFKIIPNGNAEITVNGHKISHSTPLFKGDWVQVNATGFQI